MVTVYEAGEFEQCLFLTMRLIGGTTLKKLIVTGLEPAAGDAAILAAVADALDTAHARRARPPRRQAAEHPRDRDDHPFLADFGLTRGREQPALTRSGQVVGTIDYIAPEQVRGEPAEPAGDVYALSAVLYECLTGSVPFSRPSDAAVLYAHLNEEPPRRLRYPPRPAERAWRGRRPGDGQGARGAPGERPQS